MHADWRSFNIPEDAKSNSIKVEASVENFKDFFNKNLKLNKVGILSNQMSVIGDLSGHIKNLTKEIGLSVSMLKVLEVIAYKVNVALNEVSEYGYSFNSYSESDKINLLRMKDFSQIFNVIKIKSSLGEKTLKDIININIYKSLYNNINILEMLSDEDFEKFKTAVYNYAEAGRDILASLQMIEIDSAKTGIPVDLHKYPFLSNTQDFNIKGKKTKMTYAPTWFLSLRKRNTHAPGAYASLSIQGKIFTKVSEMEFNLNKRIDSFLDENDNIIPSKRIISTNYNKKYPRIYESLKSIVELYAKERIEINKQKQKELEHLRMFQYRNSEIVDEIINQFKIKESAIVEKYNKILTIFMTKNEISIDKIVIMCYNISINATDGFYSKSFFLNVLKNEFLIYLLMNKPEYNVKLTRVKLLPEFMYSNFNAIKAEIISGDVFLNKGSNYYKIGTCNVPNGKYEINTINDLTFVQRQNANENEQKPFNKTVVLIAEKPEILSNNNTAYIKTNILNNKPTTCLYVDGVMVAGLVNYGFIPELDDKDCQYTIISNTKKRFVVELKSIDENDSQPINTEGNIKYCLIGNVALYNNEDIQSLEKPTILLYDNAVKENAYINLENLNAPFFIYDQNFDALNNADKIVGRNEVILKQLSEKLDKPYILLKRGEN